ncbi:hypothetical protein [Sorangium sp. So ce385]|uniref:hypothetical protein n=1 Tax=Sorangium sp. So ce385 TaxID=3133308 RepID=UPI003F5CA18A
MAPDEIATTFSLESYGFIAETGRTRIDPATGEMTTATTSGFAPALPSFQRRGGLTDRIDLGAHIHSLGTVGLDLKVNPVRGVFDLAVDPGAQFSFFQGPIIYMHAPVMLGVNPADWLSIVVTPGISYGIVMDPIKEKEKALLAADGLLLRGSLGLQLRSERGVAFHPELTMLKSLEGPELSFNFGIGVNDGALPSYEDLRAPM